MRVAVAALVLGLAIAPAAMAQGPYTAVPKVPSCSDGDRPETGLQGQVPQTERAGVFKGFNCNLKLVSQWEGEGASWQLASYDSCAYYSQADRVRNTGDPDGPVKPGFEHPGTVVVDVSDPAKPKASAYLNDHGTNDSWESIETNRARNLLASAEEAGPGFSVYDIKADCSKPKMLADLDVEGTGHAGGFAPDGRTYYSGQTLRAIDIADPTKPKTIYADILGEFATHDLGISEDGNRLYLAVAGLAGGTTNGLQILDSTQVQQRRPEPKLEVLGEVFWDDGGIAQNALPVKIGGKPYIVFTDENGTNPLGQPATTIVSCGESKPQFGMARLIDISNERAPKVTSLLPLEVTLPENCPLVAGDTAGTAIFGYDSHYCSVDDPQDARLLACSYFQAGLRVFDISDPAKPHEIAYYNPPMKPGYKPGSNYNMTGLAPPNGADWTPAHPQFRLERREIWFTSQMNGFQVLRFADSVPLPPPRARVEASVTPPRGARGAGRLTVRVRHRGKRLVVTGRLALPKGVSRAAGCAGRVAVSARRGTKRTVWLSRRCTFRATLRRARGPITVRFEGNDHVAPARARR